MGLVVENLTMAPQDRIQTPLKAEFYWLWEIILFLPKNNLKLFSLPINKLSSLMQMVLLYRVWPN